jgi:hypothetical protein
MHGVPVDSQFASQLGWAFTAPADTTDLLLCEL